MWGLLESVRIAAVLSFCTQLLSSYHPMNVRLLTKQPHVHSSSLQRSGLDQLNVRNGWED